MCYVMCYVMCYFMCCVMCYVMCSVIKILGKKGLVIMNNWMTILGIDPKCVLSNLRSNSKNLETD